MNITRAIKLLEDNTKENANDNVKRALALPTHSPGTEYVVDCAANEGRARRNAHLSSVSSVTHAPERPNMSHNNSSTNDIGGTLFSELFTMSGCAMRQSKISVPAAAAQPNHSDSSPLSDVTSASVVSSGDCCVAV
jgi:hypothetical protein